MVLSSSFLKETSSQLRLGFLIDGAFDPGKYCQRFVFRCWVCALVNCRLCFVFDGMNSGHVRHDLRDHGVCGYRDDHACEDHARDHYYYIFHVYADDVHVNFHGDDGRVI